MEIELEAAERALIKHAGNVAAAAKELGVPKPELRTLLRKHRQLIAPALEAQERALDKAEAALLRALRKGPLHNRIKAAAFIARSSARFRRR